MQRDVFTRPKIDAACLSHFQLTRLRLEQATSAELAGWRAHLGACDHCARRWQAERELAAECATALPPMSATKSTPSRWFTRPIFMTGGLAVAAVLLMVVMPRATLDTRQGSSEHVKGTAVPRAAVLRAGALLAQDTPLDALPHLLPGDRVRLAGAASSWYVLKQKTAAGWDIIYAGPGDVSGYLPLSLSITANAPSELTLVSCERRPSGDWQGNDVPEGCTVYAWRF